MNNRRHLYNIFSRHKSKERASLSSLPFVIDGPLMDAFHVAELNQLIVESYNGEKTSNLTKGTKKPISVQLITNNFEMKDDKRYVHIIITIPTSM